MFGELRREIDNRNKPSVCEILTEMTASDDPVDDFFDSLLGSKLSSEDMKIANSTLEKLPESDINNGGEIVDKGELEHANKSIPDPSVDELLDDNM